MRRIVSYLTLGHVVAAVRARENGVFHGLDAAAAHVEEHRVALRDDAPAAVDAAVAFGRPAADVPS